MISHFQSFIFTKIEKKIHFLNEREWGWWKLFYNSLQFPNSKGNCPPLPNPLMWSLSRKKKRKKSVENLQKNHAAMSMEQHMAYLSSAKHANNYSCFFSFSNLWNLIWLIRKNIKKHNLNNSINSLKSPQELIVKNCEKIFIFYLLFKCKMRRGF